MPDDLNWAALADPLALTAIYMGKRTFPALAAKLLAQGMSPETPAMLAEFDRPCRTAARSHHVAKLAEQLAQETVTSTAVILYGALAADQP